MARAAWVQLVLLLLLFTAVTHAAEFRIDGKDVALVERATGRQLDLLQLEGLPESLALSPDGTRLYVRLLNENSIAVYDASTLELVDWYSLDRLWRGRKMDVAYWRMDPRNGKLMLRDIEGNEVAGDEFRKEAALAAPIALIPTSMTAGGEFTLSQSSGTKGLPSADFDASGNFAIVYTDIVGTDGSGEGVFSREFNSDGSPQRGESLVNKAHNGNQGAGSLASTSTGDYVVIYRDDNNLDGDAFGVFFRRFSNGGNAKDANDVRINNTTGGLQREPSIDSLSDGDFVAVWTGPNGAKKSVFGRRYSANGTAKGNEFVIGSSSNVYAPDVATQAGGRFVVVWRDGADDQLRARVYSSSGNAITSEFKVDSGAGKQFAPSIAMDQNGNFTVAWQSNSSGGIQYRQFNADGSSRGGVRNAGSGARKEYSPSISMEPGGKFCIAWRDDVLRAYARTFNSNGDPLQPEFSPSETGGEQLEVNCALDTDMDFLVSWKFRAGGGNGSVRGRMFGGGGTPSLTVSCSADPNQGAAPLNVQFSSQASGGGGNYSYSWNFGDGGTSGNQNPSHTYSNSGNFTATVTATSGGDSATCNKTISVGTTPPPPDGDVVVTSLTQTNVNRGATDVLLAVKGSGFVDGATVSFLDPGIEVFFTNWVDATKVRVRINVHSSAFLGYHNVTLTNPDGSSATGIALLRVLQGGGYPGPTVTAIDPGTVNAGQSLTLRVLGQDFANDPHLAMDAGADIAIKSIQWISSTELRVAVDVSGGAACGPRNVVVSNAGSNSAPCAGCLNVSSNKLAITAVIPSSLQLGSGETNVTILGCGFIPESKAKIKETERISQQFVDSTRIILRVKVQPDATRGFKTVKVINSDTERVRRKDLFQIQ